MTGLLSSGIWLVSLGRYRAFHVNLRVLLANSAVGVAAFAVAALVKAVNMLRLLHGSPSTCRLSHWQLDNAGGAAEGELACDLYTPIALLTIWTKMALSTGHIVLAVERAFATAKVSSPAWLTCDSSHLSGDDV